MVRTAVLMSLLAVPVAHAQDCPVSAETGPRIASGVSLTILETNGQHPETQGLIATSSDLYFDEDCWYSGGVTLIGGEYRYFERVAVDAGGASGTQPNCDGALTDTPKRGDELVVRSIHHDDSYYANSSLVPGTVVIADEDLHPNENCFFGGAVKSEGGTPYYLYKVSFVPAKDRCPSNALRSVPAAGDTFTVTGLHSEAPSSNALQIGTRVRRPAGEMGTVEDECWYHGTLEVVNGPTVPAQGVTLARSDGTQAVCQSSAPVPSTGDRVRLTGIHRTDPYASVAGQLTGLEATVQRVRRAGTSCWLAMDVRSDEGVRYRFSAVSAEPVSDTTR